MKVVMATQRLASREMRRMKLAKRQGKEYMEGAVMPPSQPCWVTAI
jgi:hypothetical protein